MNVRKVAPRGIIRAVIACTLLGLLFTMVLTLNISNLSSVLAARDPISFIISTALGPQLTVVFLVLLLVSVVACSLVNMTGASRVLFAMARDGRFVGANWLSHVSGHKVPANAIWTIAACASVFLFISDAATALYGAGAVLFTIFYLCTVLGYAFGIRRLPPAAGFSLGKWRWPVVVAATCWLSMEIVILTAPTEFHPIAKATAVLLIVGLFVYAIWGRVRISRGSAVHSDDTRTVTGKSAERS